jgi:hypothetical protein
VASQYILSIDQLLYHVGDALIATNSLFFLGLSSGSYLSSSRIQRVRQSHKCASKTLLLIPHTRFPFSTPNIGQDPKCRRLWTLSKQAFTSNAGTNPRYPTITSKPMLHQWILYPVPKLFTLDLQTESSQVFNRFSSQCLPSCNVAERIVRTLLPPLYSLHP